MKRRDLNAGDVFVYVSLPDDFDPEDIGVIRYVPSVHGDVTPWFEGAVPSPEDGSCGALDRDVLDSPVVLLKKPEGRIGTRSAIREDVQLAIEVLEQLRDSI